MYNFSCCNCDADAVYQTSQLKTAIEYAQKDGFQITNTGKIYCADCAKKIDKKNPLTFAEMFEEAKESITYHLEGIDISIKEAILEELEGRDEETKKEVKKMIKKKNISLKTFAKILRKLDSIASISLQSKP